MTIVKQRVSSALKRLLCSLQQGDEGLGDVLRPGRGGRGLGPGEEADSALPGADHPQEEGTYAAAGREGEAGEGGGQ